MCFLRYACPQNTHLRSVNCVFSGFASLKNPLLIQLISDKIGLGATEYIGRPFCC